MRKLTCQMLRRNEIRPFLNNVILVSACDRDGDRKHIG